MAPAAKAIVAQELIAPTNATFPIVGIGASAGGLAAFEAFFLAMTNTSTSGMAFVVVQHLAPDHKSILSELIRRYTRMKVFEAEDGMVVEPDCTYIIPPNHDMAFLNGALQLLEPAAPRGHRLPIDFFFRSLAQDQRARAIGIVLSGTGSDGTEGIRAIKAEGGMVMAQSFDSTEYDGMPRSAVATGMVDYVLPPAEMPAQLAAYVGHAFGKHKGSVSSLPGLRADDALRKIFVLLRVQTGHDFSQYKANTFNRRIERRMAVHQIEMLDNYVLYLQKNPSEVNALFRDLLIGVTQFFRDPEAFKALQEEVIDRLLSNKPAGASIRVWVPGCSTGEEAYSIAILLQERMETLKTRLKLNVFATDIDSGAIEKARSGRYPASIAADVSAERLVRFFTEEPGGGFFRINTVIRDILVFSEQDVIKDPPFSKLDLISCRNLLIYMGPELQKKLVPLFHYALNPGGVLFLGTSESVGEYVGLFATLNRAAKLYQRKNDGASHPPSLGRFVPPLTRDRRGPACGRQSGGRFRPAVPPDHGTDLAAGVRSGRRAGQRPWRYPLPAWTHGTVSGTGIRRSAHEHPENGPPGVAPPFDHRLAQSGGEKRTGVPFRDSREDQRRLLQRQFWDPPDHCRSGRAAAVSGHSGACAAGARGRESDSGRRAISLRRGRERKGNQRAR